MKAYRFPEYDTPMKPVHNVAVVGGGNVAMDAARTAKRLGAGHVYLIYRRGEEEMPARLEELEHAKEEGVELKLLMNPTKIIGDDKGWAKSVECICMDLGEPDESGRRSPVCKPGSETMLNVDTVIIAIGNAPNPMIVRTTQGLKTGKHGVLEIDSYTFMTSIEGVFAGGDAVSGAATVISAMGQAKDAAKAIDEYIKAKK
jgi:glutamate synthase (NADPH/NADH) small chain